VPCQTAFAPSESQIVLLFSLIFPQDAGSTLSPSHPNLLPLRGGPTFEIINLLIRSTRTTGTTSGANLASCDGNFFTIDFPTA
jgi:hypothetical protein